MLYRPDGKRIAPRVGFIAAFDVVRPAGSADAVATMYTCQDWEPLEMMSEKKKEKL